jgi:hypothetical protein
MRAANTSILDDRIEVSSLARISQARVARLILALL